jgi:hypothetical protein
MNWLLEFLEFRNETEAVTHLSASAIQESLKGCFFSVATRRILCEPLQGHTEYVLSAAFQPGWEDAGSSRFPLGMTSEKWRRMPRGDGVAGLWFS